MTDHVTTDPHPTRHAVTAARPASTQHKRFQALPARIEKARQRLQAWQEQWPLFAQAHAARVTPLEAQWRVARRARVFELGALQGAPRWSWADAVGSDPRHLRRAARRRRRREPDAELKALYKRHAEVDHDGEELLQLIRRGR